MTVQATRVTRPAHRPVPQLGLVYWQQYRADRDELDTTAWPFQDQDRSFSSGANRPAEIHALACSGPDIGVAVQAMSVPGIEAMLFYRGTGTRFFVDSGAFSEVDRDNPLRIVAPISAAEWEKRLALYDLLAEELNDQAYLVAPDCVAHQDETLERLHTYKVRIRSWLDWGANVIVPVQRGTLSPVDFAHRVCADLGVGVDDVLWGLPMKKSATSPEAVVAFCKRLQPARIHLLGKGPTAEGWAELLTAIHAASPRTQVFSDSVQVRRLVGRHPKTRKATGVLTRVQDELRAAGCTNVKEEGLRRVMFAQGREVMAKAAVLGWKDPEDAYWEAVEALDAVAA